MLCVGRRNGDWRGINGGSGIARLGMLRERTRQILFAVSMVILKVVCASICALYGAAAVGGTAGALNRGSRRKRQAQAALLTQQRVYRWQERR